MDVSIFVIYLHLIFAIIWTGSLVALPLLFIPVLKKSDDYAKYMDLIGYRLRITGWLSLGILLLTGTYLLLERNLYKNPLMHAKLTLYVLLAVITAVHDFLGPRLGLSKINRYLGRVMLLITLFIILLAVAMLRGVVL